MINFISNCFSKIKRFFDECKKFDREYAKQFSFSSEEPCDYFKFYKIDGEKDEDYKDNIGEYPVDVDDENCIEIVLDSEVLTKHFYKLNIIDTDNYLDITSLIIPDKYRYKGFYYKITGIDSCVFPKYYWGTPKLKYINIPNTVVKIFRGAFSCCKYLDNVLIPDSVKLIGNGAFYACDNLKNIKLSSNLKKIEEDTFSRCNSLETIEIPDSVEEIEGMAFLRCPSLKSIKLSKNLKKIGEMAFYYCESLETIEIANSVEEIGKQAFEGCSSLKLIKIPKSVKKIGENAFKGIENIIYLENNDIQIENNIEEYITETEIVLSFDVLKELNKLKIIETLDKKKLTFVEISSTYFLNGVKYKIVSIDKKLFQEYKYLKNIKLPDGITKIGAFAFSKCSSLEKIIIPHSVREIEDNAFEYCFSLKIARMSKSLNIIGKDVFKDCTSLLNIINMPCRINSQIEIAGKKPWANVIFN